MNLIKQIVSLLIVAIAITVACYFLPFLNSLFEDYLVGFYIVAIVLPLGLKWYEAHMVKARAMSQPVRKKREKECKEWHREDRDAATLEPHNYDARNVDQQLHVFDGLKD